MKSIEIYPGIRIFGLTLYIENEEMLVFGDLHLGYEEELIEFGYLVPRFQYNEILMHLKSIFTRISIRKIVINGDLKHEFGRISRQEWDEVLNFIDFLEENSDEIFLIKGNHDTIIGPIAERKNVNLLDYLFIKDGRIYICHGHKIPEKGNELENSKVIIIAHDHPALTFRDGLRVEKIKCFLKGKWNDKVLIQIPSLNFVTEGTDIVTQERPLSPFMNRDISNFSAYCIEGDEILYIENLKWMK
ncbi:MAG: phosphoesterase [Candidatus Altiarchaeales archaeon]|nr:MAG: phosphoesterase [Candidatus Altiarchaeales archaeon]RLI94149.1 MAG: phosphoesterase [Candidatus Altiarchaeales archaeon]RLI95208.1 MAG: phosphoesterase [Candidatus Altiarchaeales archaeon]HDO82324.1 metallophosphoesterase [Candidatus Altiarchaeales archaeon]HEX54973.1 metallophosphoesterase [Candidatus Altiarchaeales archaeon]